jgi:hypothetical protein
MTQEDRRRAGSRLSGWKEIAAYLGKGVRTVQRWERDHGLPVHRIGQPGGEIVHAQVAELEEWLRTAEHRLAELPTDQPGSTGASIQGAASGVDGAAPAPEVLPARRVWRHKALVLTVVLVGVAVLVGAALVWRANHVAPTVARSPVTCDYSDGLLTVYDARKAILWSREFHDLREFLYHPAPHGHLGGPPAVVEDLEGDGSAEVLFLAMASRQSDEKLWCFNADGSLRFVHQPATVVRFGTTEYGPPFPVSQFLVAQDPALAGSIWVVASHALEFPTVVERLNSAGEVTAQYWNAGHVHFVAETRLRGRPVLIVGATRNEDRDASLTILDARQSGGCSPGPDPRYTCTSCGAGVPLEYIVFPRPVLGALGDQRSYAHEIRQGPAGEFTVTVLLGDFIVHSGADSWSATAYYRFDRDFNLLGAEFEDDYRRIHAYFFLAGLLKREFGPWTTRELFPVRRWDGSGFEPMPVAQR